MSENKPKRFKIIVQDHNSLHDKEYQPLDISLLQDIIQCGDDGLIVESVEEIKESLPAEPSEYTCPRCGSNVSTHICMGEPVAGETRKCNAPIEQGENVQLCCKRPLGHVGRHSIHNLPAPP